MKRLVFTWDPAKAALNEKKHGVSFDEAQAVFYDDNARLEHDPDHSDDEDRFLLLGLSVKLRVLVVCHCYRVNDSEIRLISARKATKRERKQYGVFTMRKEYDFTKSKKNPYSRLLKAQITIRLDRDTIDYFKQLAAESGISYQNLINMYLRECVASRKKPTLRWA